MPKVSHLSWRALGHFFISLVVKMQGCDCYLQVNITSQKFLLLICYHYIIRCLLFYLFNRNFNSVADNNAGVWLLPVGKYYESNFLSLA